MPDHLLERGKAFYFWRRVPADLVGTFTSRKSNKPLQAIRVSLGTKLSRREAEAMARRLSVEWEERFAAVRRERGPAPAFLIPSEIARYASERVRWRPEKDETVRRHGYTQEQLAAANAIARIDLEQTRRDLALGRTDTIGKQLEAFADLRGLDLPSKSEARRSLSIDLLKAEIRAITAILTRDSGDVVEAPEAISAPRPAKAKAAKTLREVYDKWSAVKRRPPKTIKSAEAAVRNFEAFAKDVPLHALTREGGNAFRAHLLTTAHESGNKERTAKKQLDWVKTLLNFAERDLRWIKRNLWSGISIEKTRGSPRELWEPEDLRGLFGTPLFTKYAIPKASKASADAAYWVPLLGAFTGARISEIAQLRIEDVRASGAVPYLAFRDTGEGRSLKTKATRREVPIHSRLLRLGFLEYVADIKKRGAVQVFPAINPSSSNGAGASVGQWFGEYKKGLGFGTNTKVFHSFRHTVRSRLIESGVAETIIDRLLGHEEAGERARKNTRLSLASLFLSVEKLSFAGLKLKRVYKSPAWTGAAKRVGRRHP